MTLEEAKQTFDEIDFLTWQIDIINNCIDKIYDDFEKDSFEDVTFVWNESSNFIESIILNTDSLALDISKNYKVCIIEVKGAIAELEEAMKPKRCEWKQWDTEHNTHWQGTCGAKWTIEHGTPQENHMNFCPQCGGKLVHIYLKDNA